MTDPNTPISQTPGQPFPSPMGGAQGGVQQVQPGAGGPLAYPPPPGSAPGAPPPASLGAPGPGGAMVPQAPQAPHAPQVPAGMAYPPAPAQSQPQVIHNTVVQNHYHHQQANAHLVRTSSRDKSVAVLFALFLGSLGIHRYYLGRPGSATVMLVMAMTGVLWPVVWIWSLVDMVSLLSTSRERFELQYNCSLAPGALPPARF